jgi:hypothetical protein
MNAVKHSVKIKYILKETILLSQFVQDIRIEH